MVEYYQGPIPAPTPRKGSRRGPMTVNEDPGDTSETLRAAVAEQLGAAWGGAVSLAPADAGGGAVPGRGHVLRFSVARAPAGAPASVVVKLPRRHANNEKGESQDGEEKRVFDPQ